MRTLAITTPAELRQADHKAVIAWERFMRETEHAASIRRRLAALSSLYKHLVRHDHAARNPVGEVERPAINRDEGATLAFSKPQARKLLDLPAENTVAGLRDRAILSVGLQVGLRRAEIAALTVGDLHQNRGYDSLKVMRKGGRRDALAINPQTAARLRAYLDKAGHGADIDGPLFRPLRHNGKQDEERRHMDPDAIDRVVRKYATALGLDRGYSAHSMRATFITTALENGAQLEDVQKAAGLPAFVADYNARFAKPPANAKDLHRRLRAGEDLEDAFAWKEERTLSQALTLQYDKVIFILEPSEPAKAAIGKRVTVVDYPDGRLSIRFKGVELAYRTFDKVRHVDQGAIADNKRLGAVLAMIRDEQLRRGPERRSGPRRRDQRNARLFKVG